MILVAGGSGSVGRHVVGLLTARGLRVRVLTRDPARAASLAGELVEIVAGDVRDRPSLEAAMAGVSTVVSAITGFGGTDAAGARAIDGDGNRNLIAAAGERSAATDAGTSAATPAAPDHFILVSIAGAAPDHPIELYRMKDAAEQTLRESRLAWTILRPTPNIETILGIVAVPFLQTGRTRVIGRGDNPVNLVSARDVARFVELAVIDPAMRGLTLEVAGPQNLSLNQVIRTVVTETGRTGTVSHAPVPLMRLMSAVLRPVDPVAAGQIGAALLMATGDMAVDAAEARGRYPSIPMTSLAAVVREDYVQRT